MGGGDMPGHIMASLRLYLTSPWERMPASNSFVQLVTFNHGYTTMFFPYLFYFIFFNLLNLPVTEANLVYIHSFIGILSLASIGYFLSLLFPKKITLTSLLLITLTPIHIGLSRTYVGTQVIQSIFLFSSLSFLYLYLTKNKPRYKYCYFLTTFFYIGSDNAFAIGLFLQLIFILLMSKEKKIERMTFVNLYRNFLTVVFIILPILIYLLAEYILMIKGIKVGFLGRLLSKTGTNQINFPGVSEELIRLAGPVGLLFFLSLFKLKEISENIKVLFLLIIFIIYYLIFTLASSVEGNYVFYLLLPTTVLPVYLFLNKRPVLVALLIFITLFYSFGVVYNFDIGITTPKNYGSINYGLKNNDYGIKTLGFLVRKNILPVSRLSTAQYGVITEKIGLFLDYEGAYYYLGTSFHDWPEKDLKDEKVINQYEKRFLAYLPTISSQRNEFILTTTKDKNYNLWGEIADGQKILIRLYSNIKVDKITYYDINTYNQKFDREFAKIQSLPKIWLGHY